MALSPSLPRDFGQSAECCSIRLCGESLIPIPQNVNFAIKASVAANCLQDNKIKFQIGEATQPMKPPDLADAAKAFSVYIECH